MPTFLMISPLVNPPPSSASERDILKPVPSPKPALGPAGNTKPFVRFQHSANVAAAVKASIFGEWVLELVPKLARAKVAKGRRRHHYMEVGQNIWVDIAEPLRSSSAVGRLVWFQRGFVSIKKTLAR